MYEEYIKELSEDKEKNIVNDKYNVIFKYELKDSYTKPIKSVIVTGDSKENLYLVSESREEKKYHIDLDKVFSILNKHINILDNINDKELPHLSTMDGYINTIDFKVKDKWYNYEFINLGYYSKEDIDSNNCLSAIFGLLIELDDELESQVQEVENYFVLTDEDEEE